MYGLSGTKELDCAGQISLPRDIPAQWPLRVPSSRAVRSSRLHHPRVGTEHRGLCWVRSRPRPGAGFLPAVDAEVVTRPFSSSRPARVLQHFTPVAPSPFSVRSGGAV